MAARRADVAVPRVLGHVLPRLRKQRTRIRLGPRRVRAPLCRPGCGPPGTCFDVSLVSSYRRLRGPPCERRLSGRCYTPLHAAWPPSRRARGPLVITPLSRRRNGLHG